MLLVTKGRKVRNEAAQNEEEVALSTTRRSRSTKVAKRSKSTRRAKRARSIRSIRKGQVALVEVGRIRMLQCPHDCNSRVIQPSVFLK